MMIMEAEFTDVCRTENPIRYSAEAPMQVVTSTHGTPFTIASGAYGEEKLGG